MNTITTDPVYFKRCADVDRLCPEVTCRQDAAATGFELGLINEAARLIETAGRIAYTHLVESGAIIEGPEQ